MSVVTDNDAELVRDTLAGKREAFERIVARYQSLICSLAYSATGSLGESEDLAQETFITAWNRLGHLRERHKLRSWLCGIARNRINNFLRREGREPAREAESLDHAPESHSAEPLPVEYTISQEEQAILWRSLEKIPVIYREPLVLFYREQKSIEAVAESLELSEDAVKQRLSRGRKLLHEQVLLFVEGALERTIPGKAFTVGVLAALPALSFSAKAATVGAAVKGGSTAKAAGIMGWFGFLLGPLIVLLPNYLGYRMSLAGAQSEAERQGIKTLYRKIAFITLAVCVPFAVAVLWFTRHQPDRSYLSGVFATAIVLTFFPVMLYLGLKSRRQAHAYFAHKLAVEHDGKLPAAAWEYRSPLTLLGLPLVHVRVGDRFAMLRPPVKAWIAVGARAIGGLFAMGTLAIAPVSLGSMSVGVLSIGGLALGGWVLGGIAVGVWGLFGGLIIGWQAFGGCLTLAWNAAAGDVALAHGFALGEYAVAAQANTELARQVIEANPLLRWSQAVNRHWLWTNLLWMIPFFVQWLVSRRKGGASKSA